MIAIIWIIGAILVSPLGYQKRLTWMGCLLVSLVFSPVIGLIAALVSKNQVYEKKCTHCGTMFPEKSIYCPKCAFDKSGHTLQENQVKYRK